MVTTLNVGAVVVRAVVAAIAGASAMVIRCHSTQNSHQASGMIMIPPHALSRPWLIYLHRLSRNRWCMQPPPWRHPAQ